MSKFQILFKKNYTHSRDLNKNSNTSHYFRFNIFICLLIFIFVVAYLYQVNSLTKLGYEVQELEAKVTELNTVNAQLELQAAKLQSLARIKENSVELGFIEVDNITYINNNDVTVAAVK